MTLEVLKAVPRDPQLAALARTRPPLLFVHGAFCGAWIWEEHFLPYFADRGWEAHAVSLSGHGNSRDRSRLDHYGMSDYIADVGEAMAGLKRPAVLIGHSMGGMVVQKVMDAVPPGAPPAAAVVLMCSLSPWGMAPTSLYMGTAHPDLLREIAMIQMFGLDAATPRGMRAAMLSDHVEEADARRWFDRMQPESSLASAQLTWLIPPAPTLFAHTRPPVMVMGAGNDVFVPPWIAEATAQYYQADRLHIFPDTAHAVMLEPHWEEVAESLSAWLVTLAEDTGSRSAA